MKILLIKPHYREIYKNFKAIAPEYPPLGLAYIAAVLENSGYNVKIIDMPINNITKEELKNIIIEFSPNVVGITVTTPTITYSLELAALCKQTLSNCTIVMGGAHPTALPEEVLSNNNVDVVIKGEGEYAFLEIVKNIDDKNSLQNIYGISYKNNGKIIHNSPRTFIEDVDDIPFPARHLLPIKKYYSIDYRKKPMTTIFTSRGCPGMCIYCSSHNTFGRKFRARSTKNVVDEIEILANDGFKEIHILDDTFTLDRKRAIEICNEIIKRKLKIIWCCPNGIRVNTVDKELLEIMKSAGCYQLAFGVESGNQNILNNVKKGITLEQSKKAFELCKEVGIETLGFFMIGLPGDTKETIMDTIKFAKVLEPDIAKFGITMPYPGTELFELWKSEGIIKTNDWEKYGLYSFDVVDFPNMSIDELKMLHKLAYKEFYMNRKYIMKKLRKISSIHGFLNVMKAGISIIKYTFTQK